RVREPPARFRRVRRAPVPSRRRGSEPLGFGGGYAPVPFPSGAVHSPAGHRGPGLGPQGELTPEGKRDAPPGMPAAPPLTSHTGTGPPSAMGSGGAAGPGSAQSGRSKRAALACRPSAAPASEDDDVAAGSG